jgi:hypothetical protein
VADLARVDRVLAVTRQSFRAPLDVRERVRAGLAATGPLGGSAGGDAGAAADAARGRRLSQGAGATGVARSTAALLSGLTFVAGFWLGGATSEPAAPRAPAPSAMAPGAAGGVIPLPTIANSPAVAPNAAALPTPSADGSQPRVDERMAQREGARRVPTATRPRATAGGSHARRGADVTREQRARTGAEELALLKRAEHAIRSGQPELALSLLDELERRYPRTRLEEERTAARLMARCARADANASADAARFLQNRPASVYSERVRAECALEMDDDAPDGNDVAGH